MTLKLRCLVALGLLLSLAACQGRTAEPKQYKIEMKIGDGQCNDQLLAEPTLLVLAGQQATFALNPGLRLEVVVEPLDSQHVRLGMHSLVEYGNLRQVKESTLLSVRPGQSIHQVIARDDRNKVIAWVDMKITEVEKLPAPTALSSGDEEPQDQPELRKCKVAVPTWFWLGQLAWALLDDEDFTMGWNERYNPAGQNEEAIGSGMAQPTPYMPQPCMTAPQCLSMPTPVPMAACPAATLPPWNRTFECLQMEMPPQLVGVAMPPVGHPLAMPPMSCPVPLCFQGTPCPAPPMQMCPMMPPPPPTMVMACAPPSSITTIQVVQEKGRHQMVVHHEANDLKMLVEQMEVKMAEGPPLKVTVTEKGEIEARCSEMKAYAQCLTVEGKERIVLEGKVTVRQGKHAGDDVIRTNAGKSGTTVSAEKVILYLNDGHLEIPLPRMGKEKADKAVGLPPAYSSPQTRQGCTCTCP